MAENWRAAFVKRHPPGTPILDQVPVNQQFPPWRPDPIAYSDFDSERYGGFGATTRVVMFPGDPMMVAWDFQEHPMAMPRHRGRVRGLAVPAPVPQTVGNLRRSQLEQQQEALIVGTLDIFEGIA